MSNTKFKLGQSVRLLKSFDGIPEGRIGTITSVEPHVERYLAEGGQMPIRVDFPSYGSRWPSIAGFEMIGGSNVTKEQRAIAKAEADLAALKDRAAKKAQQAAERKAKAERAKALRGLSAAGKRVVSMLQAGSADDFGCQRENVIKLVAAITGDKPDAIKRAVAH